MPNLAELLEGYPEVDHEIISILSQSPWVTTVLTDPSHTLVPTPSRYIKANGEDALFGETLRTRSTVRTCITVYNFADSTVPPARAPAPAKEVLMVVLLESGLDSFPGTCHGGMIAVLLDEVMGVLITLLKLDHHTVTAKLDVNYRKTLPTGRLALCRAKLVAEEGRKLWIEGTVEDGEGTVYSEGTGLFVKVREKI